MEGSYGNAGLLRTEKHLAKGKTGFSESFLAVNYILSHIEKNPNVFSGSTADALLKLLESERFEKKKQAYFLYRETAGVLIRVSERTTHPLAGFCIVRLQQILLNSTGGKHRAVSENLGSLPIKINGPDLPEFEQHTCLDIAFCELAEIMGYADSNAMEWHGRTLRFSLKQDKIGCIKFIRSEKDVELLHAESFWQDFIKNNPFPGGVNFDSPEPVRVNGKFVFRLNSLPGFISANLKIHQPAVAIAFIADRTYFHYPNEAKTLQDSQVSLQALFKKNARLLGRFTARGMIHTALIPLFHNRVQQSRRQDAGAYLWELGGRLDRWLQSSSYPNFAVSGIRDLEHIISVNSSRDIRHYIGEHLLGFILVMGSCFRNKAPELVGTDASGLPVDARHLFDREQFSQLIETTVNAYYKSITGTPLENPERFFTEDMIEELIDGMGIDRHMEEVLRIQDQENMDDDSFKSFLKSRGKPPSFTDRAIRGKADIVLSTGPHLGGFNQPISVPALVDFLFCISSLCVSDRYLMENGLKAYAN